MTLSFVRQYPGWLYPGVGDKEEGLEGYFEPGVTYVIDSVNPLTWRNALSCARAFSPSIVVFPWWNAYWAICFSWLANQLRAKDVEVVFLCHNVIEHEDALWKRMLSMRALSAADRFVVHTSADRDELLRLIPSAHVAVHPHPVYDQFPAPAVPLPRQSRLELLFFGFVRPYKGLDVLLAAMCHLKGQDVHLSIVGEFWKGVGEVASYVDNAGLQRQVEILPRYVSMQEAASYFARCDVVVLPYLSATGSGVLALAYHYGRPVISTRVGGLPEVIEEGVTGVLVNPGSSEELACAIGRILAGEVHFDSGAIEAARARLSWKGLASTVLDSGGLDDVAGSVRTGL